MDYLSTILLDECKRIERIKILHFVLDKQCVPNAGSKIG